MNTVYTVHTLNIYKQALNVSLHTPVAIKHMKSYEAKYLVTRNVNIRKVSVLPVEVQVFYSPQDEL